MHPSSSGTNPNQLVPGPQLGTALKAYRSERAGPSRSRLDEHGTTCKDLKLAVTRQGLCAPVPGVGVGMVWGLPRRDGRGIGASGSGVTVPMGRKDHGLAA